MSEVTITMRNPWGWLPAVGWRWFHCRNYTSIRLWRVYIYAWHPREEEA